MTDPTTEPADVDTPKWPGPLVTVVAATEVPEDNATAAAKMADDLLADVAAYREQVRPIMEACARLPERAYEDVSTLRRSVAILADVLGRRVPGGSIPAQVAVRYAERIAGMVVARGITLGSVKAAEDVLGSATERCLAMATPDDEEFLAAVEVCTDLGAAGSTAMTEALRDGTAPQVVREQRATMARLIEEGTDAPAAARVLGLTLDRTLDLAERYDLAFSLEPEQVEPVDADAVLREIVAALSRLRERAAEVGPASVAGLSVPQAADFSRQLWDLLVPLVGLRKAVDDRSEAR